MIGTSSFPSPPHQVNRQAELASSLLFELDLRIEGMITTPQGGRVDTEDTELTCSGTCDYDCPTVAQDTCNTSDCPPDDDDDDDDEIHL